MSDDKLKQQRDRFLAFSFASSDLLIEIAEDATIAYALGAAKSLIGPNEKNLIGQDYLALFSPLDRSTIAAMKDTAKIGTRCGPFLVKLDEAIGDGRQAVVTGLRMPDNDKFYLTIGATNLLMARHAQQVEDDAKTLHDKDSFLAAASDALDLARSLGQEVDMTLVDIDNIGQIQQRMGADHWQEFSRSITHLLNSKSVDGQAAAEISEGRYSIIHDNHISPDMLKDEIVRLSRATDPSGLGFEISSKTVSADLSSMSERETTKALIYTINEFERNGTAMTIESLNSGFKTYVTANAQKIVQFKSMVEQLNFDLHFQPIVNLDSGELSHYEMLSRFRGEGSTQEWIIFGEDIGMAPDFDIAVCERAINYLLYKSQAHRTKFAINLSGQSMQNEQFFKTLYAKLLLHKELANRLIFEITESTMMQDLDMVNYFIQALQGDGYEVCLDDFGAGSASFQYLHRLNVNYVKIDGAYTRRILTSERDTVMVKNLAQLCRDLNIKVIAEMVEEQAQADRLRNLGIQFGQGYYFGKPAAKPEYDAPSKSKRSAIS